MVVGRPPQGYRPALKEEAELCVEACPGDLTNGRVNKQGAEGQVRYDPRRVHACGCVRARMRERGTGTQTQTVSVSALV